MVLEAFDACVLHYAPMVLPLRPRCRQLVEPQCTSEGCRNPTHLEVSDVEDSGGGCSSSKWKIGGMLGGMGKYSYSLFADYFHIFLCL